MARAGRHMRHVLQQMRISTLMSVCIPESSGASLPRPSSSQAAVSAVSQQRLRHSMCSGPQGSLSCARH